MPLISDDLSLDKYFGLIIVFAPYFFAIFKILALSEDTKFFFYFFIFFWLDQLNKKLKVFH